MGIKQQALMLYKTVPLSTDSVITLVKLRYAAVKDKVKRRKPAVVIDASLIGYLFIGAPSTPAGGVFIIAETFSRRGVDVLIVLDGIRRHHSKRATWQRNGERETARVSAIRARVALCASLRAGVQGNGVEKQQKTIKRLENKSSRMLPNNFSQQITKLVEEYQKKYCTNQNNIGSIIVSCAPWQADPEIARLALTGAVDVVISGDSDFPMYIGHNDYNSDLMLRHPKINKGELVEFGQAATGQMSVKESLINILQDIIPGDIFVYDPKFPIFNGIVDPNLRALIAVSIGCDVLPNGIPNFGPSKAAELLHKESSAEEYAIALSHVKNTPFKVPEIFHCLAAALVSEPTCQGYLVPPTTLPKYLEEFGGGLIPIYNGPEVVQCQGVDREHLFLAAEGILECFQCCGKLCRYCTFQNDDGTYECMPCARGTSCSTGTTLSEREMRGNLATKWKAEVPAAASFSHVMQLHDKWEDEEEVLASLIDDVEYPIHPPKILHPSDSTITRIKEVPMQDIAHIIRDKSCDGKDIVDFLNILASLVDFNEHSKGKVTYHNILPKNLLEFANKSRIDGGERLCRRAIRHATDPGTCDILDAALTLGRYNNEVCIILVHQVSASMKTHTYNTSTAFTSKKLLASSCNCKAGCRRKDNNKNEGDERILCTHGLGLLEECSISLTTSIAQHILAELRQRLLDEDFEYKLNEATVRQMRADLRLLIMATGTPALHLLDSENILDWLSPFAVGTELTKRLPGRPRIEDLGKLREKMKKVESPEKLAFAEIKHLNKDPHPAQQHEIRLPHLEKDVYSAISVLNDAISIYFENEKTNLVCKKASMSHSKPVALRLIPLRAGIEYENYAHRHKAVEKQRATLLAALGCCWSRSKRQFSPQKKNAKSQTPTTKMTQKEYCPTGTGDGPTNKVCCAVGCNETRGLKRLPAFPPVLPDNASQRRRTTHKIKTFVRQEWSERLGAPRYNMYTAKADFRYCPKHPMTKVKKYINIPNGKRRKCKDGKMVPVYDTILHEFTAPVSTHHNRGILSPAINRMNKGNGCDRRVRRDLDKLLETEAGICAYQQSEANENQSAPNENYNNIQKIGDIQQCSSLLVEMTGLNVHHRKAPIVELDPNKLGKKATLSEESLTKHPQPPKVILDTLTPSEVKRRTGFSDVVALLSYVSAVCEGNISVMCQKISSMTWLEEWFLFFEFVYGRTNIRWDDMLSAYSLREKSLRAIIKEKIKRVIVARKRWPMLCSHLEDLKLRNVQWNRHFNDKQRVVMHDNTNVPLKSPTNANLQRALYSQYYGDTVAKGGVSLQLCGWIRTMELCTGAIDDSGYCDVTEVFREQQDFVNEEAAALGTEEVVDVLNVLDKGYRCTLAAIEKGQRCLQPKFGKDSQQFKRDETLHSACVAVIRAGNERAVNRVKMSWFLKRGTKDALYDTELLADIWLAWGFQINFMYETVL